MQIVSSKLGIVAVAVAAFSAFGATAGVAACAGDGRTGYPTVWWQEVARDGAPDWEILPQEAGPCEVILSKRNELGILSNFAATAFTLEGVRYASVEGFWQMMKYPEGPNDIRTNVAGVVWAKTRAEVGQLTAFEAKDAGKVGSKAMEVLGINWVTYKGQQLPYRVAEKGEHYRLIVAAMRAKLEQNPDVKAILLKTGDLTLMPDHKQEPNTSPAWQYFAIWTEIRSQLQAEAAKK